MKLTIDHSSTLPLYAQVEELLRKLIILPEYQEGKFLPNEVDMSKELGISRNTLRQATNKLVYEGLLHRKKGVGTTVTKAVDSKASNWISFSKEMKSKGIKVVNYSIKFTNVVPDDNILNFFCLTEGTEVLKMERLRGNESEPFVFFVSYFHPRIGLTGKENYKRPLYNIMEEDYSVVAKTSREEISAIPATKYLSENLRINKTAPVLKRQRYVYDPGGRPIEFGLAFYKSDSIVYTVESLRPD